MARPEHQPTDKERKQVEQLSGMGLRMADIAKVVGIAENTLRKHYSLELENGGHKANAQVAASLFRQATDPDRPNVAAAIFWMKARAGWSDVGGDIGKKEAAAENARTAAGGRFGTRSAPLKLVNKD